MSEDDDDFEDATDSLERPGSSSVTAQEKMEPAESRPSALPVAATRTVFAEPALIPRTNIQCPTPVAASNFSKAQDAISSSSRRDRLTALRHRMRNEFGARDAAATPMTTSTDGDDSLSLISDVTSLHSWHRRVLAGSETVVVQPSDSMSTRAASTMGRSQMWSPNEEEVASSNDTLVLERFTSIEAQPERSPDAAQKRAPSAMASPVGPPPAHPPPPLPARDRAHTVGTPSGPPPPLPPRNPSIRLPQPMATELVAKLAPSIEEDSFHTPDAQNSAETLTYLTSRSQRLSTNSNDSISSIGEGGIRRRGHAKSNSLDRGLTLAKTLKAGPFPPPANKTNSLTRQEEGSDGEEGERNMAAQGVIQQITTAVLPSDKGDVEVLEVIPSGSSSVSSPSSDLSKKNKSANNVPHETVLEESECAPNVTVSPSEDDVHLPLSEDDMRETSTSMCSSIDPITRDMIRRLSLKRDGTLHADQMSEDNQSDRFSTTRSTVDHAKTLARSYGSFASGLFRGAIQKVKGVAHVGSSVKTGEETTDSEGEQSESEQQHAGPTGSIVRPRKAKKGPFDFEQTRVVQELNNEHTGAVWCIRFSICGRLIATAGQDAIIRVWAIKSHMKYFQEMRERYQQKSDSASDVYESTLHDMESFRPPSSSEDSPPDSQTDDPDDMDTLMAGKPFAVFKGHTADILDLSWSKNYFILSSGMDRTVKLWHLSRGECLCCFQHVDFVTCVAFLPKDDRYFLSGSLDGKLRLWYIPDKKVAVWNEVQVKFITAITFVKNGKFAVVGTYNGRCYFYTSDQLKYHTVVDVRSTRGKNARGHKVTGLAVHGDKLLVTSNDSRIRMYDVRDKALTCKFRGAQNEHSQIRAAFSPDGKHIVCGSEDKFVYVWRTSDLPSTLSVRKDRNAMWERIRAHTAPVSVAVFAPKPQVFFSLMDRRECGSNGEQQVAADRGSGHVIVSADLSGSIKIMVNRPRLTKTGHSTFFPQEA